jgi:hypothetical protein
MVRLLRCRLGLDVRGDLQSAGRGVTHPLGGV